jgi:hypothetical protein
MRAPFSFSRWSGLRFLGREFFAEGSLTPPNIREKRSDVKTVLGREFFTVAMNFRDNRIFPHIAILP